MVMTSLYADGKEAAFVPQSIAEAEQNMKKNINAIDIIIKGKKDVTDLFWEN